MIKAPATPVPKEKLRYFATAAEFRAWLEIHHTSATELWVGFHRKSTGRPSITWPQAVEEALCFGWIDGIRKSVDDESYANRFTPRKATSNWSAVNIAKVGELESAGRMRPAGRAAFARRRDEKSAVYSFENRKSAKLSPEQERRFQRNAKAWRFYIGQPAGYRRMSAWWVISAKQPATRERRLQRLISESAAQRRIY